MPSLNLKPQKLKCPFRPTISTRGTGLSAHVRAQHSREYGKWNRNPNRLIEAAQAALPQQGPKRHRRLHPVPPSAPVEFQQRCEGYEKSMLENSLDPLARIVGLAGNQVENGRAAVSLILDQKGPITAILAGSDEIAPGAKEGLMQHGLTVPRDVSVICFQHQIETFSAAPLTSVYMDAIEVGRQLAKSAIRRIESNARDIPESSVPTVLVKRGSCRPLRAEEHMVL